MCTPGPQDDLTPRLAGVICTGDSFGTYSLDGIVDSVYPIHATTSGHQLPPDRSHLKRKSSDGIKKLIELEKPNNDSQEDGNGDEEETWEEDYDSDEAAGLWLPEGVEQDDVMEATGNVDDILNILGLEDAPLPRKRRRNKKTDNDSAVNGDRSVLLDSDEIRGANGFVWDTVPQTTLPSDETSRSFFVPGPTGEALEAIDPIECFKLFVTDKMMDEIISATNATIDEEIGKSTKRSRDCHFQPVGADEFSALVSLVILSGALQNNRLRSELLFDSMFSGDQFRATMPGSRFNILLNVLAFESKETIKNQSSTNKFIPISKLWNSFIDNCKKHYVPGSHVTIGKQIVPFRGHGCPFIVTTHSPVRHGIQVFLMVDNTSKFMINAVPYLGKNTLPQDCSIESFAVNCLVDPIVDSDRNVTMDEWFTSVSLVKELLEESKLTAIGQIKTNKKELPEFFSDMNYKHRKSGSSILLYAGNVTAVSYKPCNNTGLLSLVSTCHKGQALTNESGKPQVVLDYEATRGAVEAFLGNCSKMTTGRKTFRWPLTMFYQIIDMAIQNSYVVYSHNFISKRKDPKARVLSKLDFALTLVRQLSNAWMRSRLDTPIASSLKSMIRRSLNIPRRPEDVEDASNNEIEDCSSALRGTNPIRYIPSANITRVTAFTLEKDQLVLDDKCRQQCSFCSSKTRRKTRWLCGTCRRTICIEHSRRMCIPCWENYRKSYKK
uniref:PiggyBac transposable element-derived protein 4 n=4 Tax=Lygus hesperus TaxID=30085 RepID=A0A146LP75_LYGHE